jgi:hypothetical protein
MYEHSGQGSNSIASGYIFGTLPTGVRHLYDGVKPLTPWQIQHWCLHEVIKAQLFAVDHATSPGNRSCTAAAAVAWYQLPCGAPSADVTARYA